MNRRTFFGALAALPVVAGAEPVAADCVLSTDWDANIAARLNSPTGSWVTSYSAFIHRDGSVSYSRKRQFVEGLFPITDDNWKPLPVDRQEVSSD